MQGSANVNFWDVQYVASFLAGGGLTGCGEVGRGGCLFACNFSVTMSTVLMEAEINTRPNMSLLLH